MAISENVANRRDYLVQWLKPELKGIPVTVHVEDDRVLVLFQEMLVCGIQVEEEYYRIYNVSEEWKGKISYLCEKNQDGSWYYYLESVDECIAECKRLVLFEAKKRSKKVEDTGYSSAPIESTFWQNRLREILGTTIKERVSGRKTERGKSLLRFECFGTGSANRMRIYLHNEADEHDDDPEIISVRIGHEVVPEDDVKAIKPASAVYIPYRDECKVKFEIDPDRRKDSIEEAFGFRNVMGLAKY